MLDWKEITFFHRCKNEAEFTRQQVNSTCFQVITTTFIRIMVFWACAACSVMFIPTFRTRQNKHYPTRHNRSKHEWHERCRSCVVLQVKCCYTQTAVRRGNSECQASRLSPDFSGVSSCYANPHSAVQNVNAKVHGYDVYSWKLKRYQCDTHASSHTYTNYACP